MRQSDSAPNATVFGEMSAGTLGASDVGMRDAAEDRPRLHGQVSQPLSEEQPGSLLHAFKQVY